MCNECDFEFSGGHSHNEGGAFAVCIECLTFYNMRSKGMWGPKPGERIELNKFERMENDNGVEETETPTGIYIMVSPSENKVTDLEDHEYDGWGYQVDDVECVNCKTKKLIVAFKNKDKCPKCKKGELDVGSVMY